jgi:hypothetical protein
VLYAYQLDNTENKHNFASIIGISLKTKQKEIINLIDLEKKYAFFKIFFP